MTWDEMLDTRLAAPVAGSLEARYELLRRQAFNVVEFAADLPHLERDYPELARQIDGLRVEVSE